MRRSPLVTVLSGGLGGARLALGLAEIGLASETVFVTNVADDVEVDGLLVCPDTDAVLYALAGIFDDERGWGIRDDVFLPATGAGPAAWFSIGLRDRSHHERRAELMAGGRDLVEATAALAVELGVEAGVVPVTADRVRTLIGVGGGPLGFQEWLVRDGAAEQPEVVTYDGADSARAAPAAVSAIESAALVVIASSSPVASIAPILAVPGIREALGARSESVAVLSPVVARRLPSCERDVRRSGAREKLLRSLGVEHSPVAVAELYAGLGRHFFLDPADAVDEAAIAALGYVPEVSTVTAETQAARVALAQRLASLASASAGGSGPRILANTRLSI